MGKAKTKGVEGRKPKRPKQGKGKDSLVLAAAARLGVEILTLDEAAALLRVSVDALKLDAENEKIPARLIGGEWRFVKQTLLDWLSNPQARRFKMSEFRDVPPERIRKAVSRDSMVPNASQLSAIGTMADDDTLQAMTDEIYRRRATQE